MGKLSVETAELLRLLSRGGGWCNYWTNKDTPPVWWPSERAPAFIDTWQAVYFSVNPRFTRLGGLRRGGNGDIKAVNCFYCDHDHTDVTEVLKLYPLPTAIVLSGGGVHTYHIFNQPLQLNEDNDLQIADLQRRWVKFREADPAATDLSRVLRVPGSLNRKYDPPRPVELTFFDFSRTYDPAELSGMLPAEEPQTGWQGGTYANTPGNVDKFYSRAFELARTDGRNAAGMWLACQLRDCGLSSSEVYTWMARYQGIVTGWKSHPYSLAEARDTIKSAFSKPRREPPAALVRI